MHITKHAFKRIKQRVGLPKRAHLRHVQRVIQKGSLFSHDTYREFQMLYMGFLYIFKLTPELNPILVTTMQATSNDMLKQVGR
jgi:hypothetical protein